MTVLMAQYRAEAEGKVVNRKFKRRVRVRAAVCFLRTRVIHNGERAPQRQQPQIFSYTRIVHSVHISIRDGSAQHSVQVGEEFDICLSPRFANDGENTEYGAAQSQRELLIIIESIGR